jgi:drug/metabolite transporter (DMT)-like permease
VPLTALLLALAAACLHAGWNVLLAGARDSEAATAVALVVAAVAFAPVAVVTWDVESGAWPYIVASAALELLYFGLLAAAYRRSELALVYPLARGAAPVLVLIGSVVILSHGPGVAEAVGVVVVAAGVLLVRGVGGHADRRGTALALLVGMSIAAYTLVDKEGLRYADPLPYLELVLAGPALVYAAGIAVAKGRPALRAESRPATALAGLAMFGAYGFVLAALQRAPAAPVAAVRETSVVIAVVLAAIVLREHVTRRRLAGSAVVAAGIALIALG